MNERMYVPVGRRKRRSAGVKKHWAWISLGVAVLVIVSFIIYKNIKGRAETVSGYDEPVAVETVPERDPEEIYRNIIGKTSSGSEDAHSEVVIDIDSIPGLTECKPFDRKLVEEGSRNILIIGEDKEAKLYDTIGIVSIDSKNEKIKVIMIPRDTYIKYNKKVLHYLEKAGKASIPGVFKINFAYNIGPIMKYEGKFKPYTSISFLADVIKEKFGVTVDDYVKVNTDTFVQIVDLFGGVEIDVPYDMNYEDPVQDLSIHLTKGLQHLDGKQAEGFVRFRQGYREDGTFFEIGDEGRKNNQITFIKEFIRQHGTLANIDKIPGLLSTLGKNVQHSMGVGDLLFRYLGIARDVVVKKYEIEGETLRGELKWIDGVQYMIINGE